ncbi:MAG: hypothetical protein AAFX93_09195 [Verrucomicrobiota bacterium]
MRLSLLVSWVCFVPILSAQSFTFDWDSVSWGSGTTSNTFNDVDGSGVDVTISISGGSFLAGFPQITQNQTGGLSPAQDALELFINESASGNGLTLTMTFSEEIENLSLTLFDVDTGPGGFFSPTFRDQVTFAETPTTFSDSAANFVSGASAFGISENVPTSAGGNVSASFSAPRTSLQFFYGAGPFTQTNPAQQAISLYDFTFEVTPVVPEPGTWIAGGTLVAACAIYSLRRRKRRA